ncbi:MAG: hypothetical protein KC668_31830, partial [Myxococcales bacterium]|nr:hypothetical protein [Myxococcales bacterium]
AVDDTVGEWFEVYVAAASGVDLNGLQVGNTFGTTRFTLTRDDCVRALPGSYVVFARNGSMAMNGGLSASAIAYGFALTNSGGALFIGVNDGLLDAVGWTSSPPGVSLQLEPSDYDHNTNDAFRAAACDGTTAYGAGDLGTPGSVNNTCLDAGECWDAGVARAIVSPAVGQLYINEVM